MTAMTKKPELNKLRRVPLLPKIRTIDVKARTIEFVASTEAVDRYGDVIRVAGWKYQNYLKNPVFLWAHQSRDLPIGKCVDLKIETNPPALVQTIEFASKDVYPLAETVFSLYRDGFMRAVSVGFMPTESPMPMADEEGNMTGWEFAGQELLELSAVAIPANPEALARAIGDGVLTEDDIKNLFTVGEQNHAALGVSYAVENSRKSEQKEETIVKSQDEPVVLTPAERKEGKPGVADVLARVVEARAQIDTLAASMAKQPDLADATARIDEIRGMLAKLTSTVGDFVVVAATKTELADVVARCEELRARIDKQSGTAAKESGLADIIARSEELRGRIDKLSGSAVKKSDLADVFAKLDATRTDIANAADASAKKIDLADASAKIAEIRGAVASLADVVAKDSDLVNVASGIDEVRARVDSLSATSATKAEVSDILVRTDEIRSRLDTFGGVLTDCLNAIRRTPAEPAAAEKTVCPYTDDPIAPKGTAWDAPAEMAKQTRPDGWKHMSTVIVGDAKLRGSYKLPHHSGSGFKVIPNGVRAALGRIEQTQMDSADRAGARSHLAKHQEKISAQAGIDFDYEGFELKLAQLGEVYRSAEAAGLTPFVVSIDREIAALVATLPPDGTKKNDTISTPEELFAQLVKA